MSSHDAHKAVADLRDHLARHDKPIAFLFGAGTSCSVEANRPGGQGDAKPLIPAVAQLTEICHAAVAAIGPNYKKAWANVQGQCAGDKLARENRARQARGEAALAVDATGATTPVDVEAILSRVRMMLEAMGTADTLLGLDRAGVAKFEETVRRTIAKTVNPDHKLIPTDTPHCQMARWLARMSRKMPVEIFTLNYDVLIEMAFEAERIPLFDGFVGSFRPFFLADSLRRPESAPGANWVRLWKMHGSVSWRREELGGRTRIIRGEPDDSGEMILPSFHKYDESRQQPYAAFIDRLARFLDQDDALLITCGFSFGDEHINNVIFSAIESRQRTHVYALQYVDPGEHHDLHKRALRQRNIVLIGPKTGIIGGRLGNWSAQDTAPFGGAFEIDAEASPGTSAKSGQMRLGDFERFCRFLSSMGER